MKTSKKTWRIIIALALLVGFAADTARDCERDFHGNGRTHSHVADD